MRRRARCLLVAAAWLGGCGSATPELFELHRSGSVPAARLTLLVFDDGTVRCDRRPPRRMSGDQLLLARELTRALQPLAARGLHLPPGPGRVLSYRVRLSEGAVSFSDTSRGQSPQLTRVQGFTRSVAKDVCGLPR